jgi:hypothetical protein
MNKTSFQEQTDAYAESLADFIAKHELPAEWFEVPDHVAVKGADKSGFKEMLELLRPLANRMTIIDIDNRQLATAEMKFPLAVGLFGKVSWVEIMEPRPEKAGKDVVGFEHMEFYCPDFKAVRAVLDEKRIHYEMQQNPGHKWVNIVINEHGQELKLNNILLADVVTEELKSGKSRVI